MTFDGLARMQRQDKSAREKSGPSGSGIDSFVRNLKHHPVLGREEEHRLALLYRDTHDPQVARRLVEGHLRLVVKIARACCFHPAALPDLIQEGSLGLMKAVTKYDPDRGVRLSTYASWWIRAYIFQHAMVSARMMRLVTTFPQRKLFFALRRERAKMSAAGERLDDAKLADRLGVSVKDLLEMESRLEGRDVQLDAGAGEESGRGDGELTQDRILPDEELGALELQHAVRSKMKMLEQSLGAREKLILEHRLVAEDPLTLQEIGRRCGVSRERARQLETRLKKRLEPHFGALAGVVHPGAAALA